MAFGDNSGADGVRQSARLFRAVMTSSEKCALGDPIAVARGETSRLILIAVGSKLRDCAYCRIYALMAARPGLANRNWGLAGKHRLVRLGRSSLPLPPSE